jgi:hypothetical protein
MDVIASNEGGLIMSEDEMDVLAPPIRARVGHPGALYPNPAKTFFFGTSFNRQVRQFCRFVINWRIGEISGFLGCGLRPRWELFTPLLNIESACKFRHGSKSSRFG